MASSAAVGPDESISLMVMAYNEAASLEGVVHELHGTLASLGRAYELVIIDDGSRDGTAEIADRLAGELPHVRVVRHAENLGLGGVYRTGYAAARCDLLTFFPADGQFPSTILTQFLPHTAHADMVLGYLARRDSWLGRVLSSSERLLYRLMFGPLPRFQGIMLLRRRLLDEIPLRSTGRGWAIVLELVLRAQRRGVPLVSVQTALRPRQSGRSKVNNVRTVVANLRQALTLRRLLDA